MEGEEYSEDEDLVLFAKWSDVPAYSITYDWNDADLGSAPTSQLKYQDESVQIADNTGQLGKYDFTFAGWNTAADGSGTDYAPGVSYSGNADLTLFARWAPSIITDVIASGDYSLILKNDGSVWLLGNNYFTSTVGAVTVSWTPLKILYSKGAAITTGGGSSFVFRPDGTVWAGGRNSYGQLGSGLDGTLP